jgi:hypothetical protein
MLAAATLVVSNSKPAVSITVYSEIQHVYHYIISRAGYYHSGGVLSSEYHAE